MVTAFQKLSSYHNISKESNLLICNTSFNSWIHFSPTKISTILLKHKWRKDKCQIYGQTSIRLFLMEPNSKLVFILPKVLFYHLSPLGQPSNKIEEDMLLFLQTKLNTSCV